MGIELPPWWAHVPIELLAVTAALILGYALAFVHLAARKARLYPVAPSKSLSLLGAVGFVALAGSAIVALSAWLDEPLPLLEGLLLGLGLLTMGLAGSAAVIYWLQRGAARTALGRGSVTISVLLFAGSAILAGAVYRLVVGGILRLILR